MTVAVLTLADAGRQAHVDKQKQALARWAPEVRHHQSDLGPDRNLARARNAAGDRAMADGAEHLIFLDADCIPGPELVERYRDCLTRHPADVACGPVTYLDPPGPEGYRLDALTGQTAPHPARPNPPTGQIRPGTPAEWELFWSLSFAVTAQAWRSMEHFDESYTGYGGEDTDFAFRQRAAGRTLRWVGGAHAYHQWHPVSSPPWEHLDDILANAGRFHRRWGVWPMRGWMDAFAAAGAIVYAEGRWRRSR